jgi:hypothetical protein
MDRSSLNLSTDPRDSNIVPLEEVRSWKLQSHSLVSAYINFDPYYTLDICLKVICNKSCKYKIAI